MSPDPQSSRYKRHLSSASHWSRRFTFFLSRGTRARAEVLKQIVEEMQIPTNFDVGVAGEKTFEAAFHELLQSYQSGGKLLPPTFAFIDPFGWKGVLFSVVREIMKHQSCEVLITFMYEEINRFIGHPDQESNFGNFFGSRDWRQGVELAEPRARNRFLHDLYLRQLHTDAKATYVRSFEMRNDKDVTDYFLFTLPTILSVCGK